MPPQTPRTSWRPPELSFDFHERVAALWDDENPLPPPGEPLREGPHAYCGIEHAAALIPRAEVIFYAKPILPHLEVLWCRYDGRRWTEDEVQTYLYEGEVPRAYWGKDIRPPVMLFVGEREPGDDVRLWELILQEKQA